MNSTIMEGGTEGATQAVLNNVRGYKQDEVTEGGANEETDYGGPHTNKLNGQKRRS